MNIDLSPTEILDLVMILGAANGAFASLAEDPTTPGIFKALMINYATRSNELRERITEQHNAQTNRS